MGGDRFGSPLGGNLPTLSADRALSSSNPVSSDCDQSAETVLALIDERLHDRAKTLKEFE
jgi:hypothetical protein